MFKLVNIDTERIKYTLFLEGIVIPFRPVCSERKALA